MFVQLDKGLELNYILEFQNDCEHEDCELLVVGGKLPRVVALGKVYQNATTLHNVPLSPDVAKVTVEKVRFLMLVFHYLQMR